MKAGFNLKGMKSIQDKMNAEVKAISGKSMKGLIGASIIIRRSMDSQYPKIPVDTGNLRASWYATPVYMPHPGIFMGFTASYAWEVHSTDKHYKRKDSGAGFFQKALENNYKNILEEIRKEALI